MKFRTSVPAFSGMLILAFLAISCGRDQQDNPPAPAPAVQAEVAPVLPAPSLCETLKYSFSTSPNSNVRPVQTKHIERHFQRVLRHDCAGNLTSDKVETVLPPHAELEFKNPSKRSFKGVLVFNAETCNHRLTVMPVANWPLIGSLYAVTGDGKKRISVKGDLADALLTFQVAPGINHLFVRYYHDCLPSNIEGQKPSVIVGTPDCEVSQDYTTVEYPIEVTSSEKNLDGFQTLDPSPESCAQKKKTKGL